MVLQLRSSVSLLGSPSPYTRNLVDGTDLLLSINNYPSNSCLVAGATLPSGLTSWPRSSNG